MGKGQATVQVQTDKIFRHIRQNSYGTRDRYHHSCKAFARYCADKFKLQNIKNLHDKHVASYVKDRMDAGMAPKTIKNDLAAIRFLHDQISRPKNRLSENKELQKKYDFKIEKTPQITGNKAWTREEYQRMQHVAETLGREDVKDTMILSRTMGLRVTESVAATRAQAEHALKTGLYKVGKEAKNGKPRQVPLSREAKEVFQRRLAQTRRGQKLFVRENEKTHHVVNRLEKFIEHHRDQVTTTQGLELRLDVRDPAVSHPLIYHGLRYSYVQERMSALQEGLKRENAAATISKEVGHERTEVINIYTAGK